MKRLFLDQRRALGEFCGNFAVAWLAAGLVPAFLARAVTTEVIKSAGLSFVMAGISLMLMLYFTKGGRR